MDSHSEWAKGLELTHKSGRQVAERGVAASAPISFACTYVRVYSIVLSGGCG